MISKKIEEIKLLMQYAVPEKERGAAQALLEKFNNDRIALNLFHSFYSFLPEGLDDSISKILLVHRKEGAFLLCAITGIDNYLYLVTHEMAEFLGRRDEGIWEDKVLHFFGFKSREDCIENISSLSNLPTYRPAHTDEDLCPICFAATDEFHTLGCPVEICPWCDGQLTACDCRFTMAGKDKLKNDADLDGLLEQLNKKGRVPFDAKSQRPSFPKQEEKK